MDDLQGTAHEVRWSQSPASAEMQLHGKKGAQYISRCMEDAAGAQTLQQEAGKVQLSGTPAPALGVRASGLGTLLT